MGCSCEFIDYDCSTFSNDRKILVKPLSPASIIRDIRALTNYKNLSTRKNKFEEFMKKNYNISKKKYYNNLDFSDMDYDYYVTGSDQTFCLHLRNNPEEMKAFLMENVQKGKKVSYASSMGEKFSEITKEEEKWLAERFKEYECLAVREEKSADYIEKLTGNRPKVVLDPTLLLNKNDWDKLSAQTKYDNEDYILFYTVLSDKWVIDYVELVSEITGLKIIAPHLKNRFELSSKFTRADNCGPEEFIALIKNAKIVITTSFHATAFAINYNVPFQSLLLGEGNRLRSLLKTIKLEGRIIKEEDSKQFGVSDFSVDFSISNKILDDEREKSKNYLKKALEAESNKFICDRNNCTGCFSCVNACPKACITMEENEIGHIYPQIDEDICINCGVCQKSCPNNNKINFNEPQKTYAAWSLNEKEHEKSTSGGIAAYLTRKIIENGGVVYGCSSVVSDEVHHIRVDNLDDIKKLQGSKYVQSFINDTYIKAKDDLKAGKQVLFIGTPCQISGLNSYLTKEYDNLTTFDLICHGVPPQKLLFDHMNLVAEGSEEKILSFREKNGYYLNIANYNKTLYYKHQYDDLYYLGFGSSLFYRDSCYTCKYATDKRCSDITLGDFWGLGKDIPFEHENANGVSVVLVNTKKGQSVLEEHKSGLFTEERTLEEAVKGNPQLNHPTKKHLNAKKFINDYRKEGFEIASQKSLVKDIKKYKLLKVLQKSKLAMKIISKLK